MAKTPSPEEIPVAVIDNLGAPDVPADACVGAFLTNGNVHITFASRRCDYSQTPNVFRDVVIGRLVMPFAAAENMTSFLTDFLARMKKQMANPPVEAPKVLQ